MPYPWDMTPEELAAKARRESNSSGFSSSIPSNQQMLEAVRLGVQDAMAKALHEVSPSPGQDLMLTIAQALTAGAERAMNNWLYENEARITEAIAKGKQ